MAVQIKFRRRFDFSKLPKTWNVVRVALDWNGKPLLLLSDGKLPPWVSAPPNPPTAHHLIFWDDTIEQTVTFEQSANRVTVNVQRLADGWLLSDARDGRATLYDGAGAFGETIDIGDGIEDVQKAAIAS